jgi:hypothetical protein
MTALLAEGGIYNFSQRLSKTQKIPGNSLARFIFYLNFNAKVSNNL